MSNLILSQTTNTNPTKCLPVSQVSEIYKGLKQNSYLKIRLNKTEEALTSADKVIIEQKGIIGKQTELIKVKDELTASAAFQCDKEKEIRDIKIKQLEDTMALKDKQAKRNERKKLWSGIKLGTGIGVVATVAAFLLVK